METQIVFELLPDEIAALKIERSNVDSLCQDIIRGYVRRQRRRAANKLRRHTIHAQRAAGRVSSAT